MAASASVDKFRKFEVAFSNNFGYVYSFEVAKTLKESHELENTLRFVSLKTSLQFGATPIDRCKHRILWEEAQPSLGAKIPYDGVPFIHLNKNLYECEYAKDHKFKTKAKAKEARAEKRVREAHVGNAHKARNLIQDTKKKDCVAKLVMKEVMKFPEFKVSKNSSCERRKGAKKASDAIAAGEARGERRIYIYLPEETEHVGHPVGSICGARQRVDHRIIEFVQRMVGAGVTSMSEMRLHVERFVTGALFKGKPAPDLSNRRYFPEDNDIRYHMYAAEGKKKPPKTVKSNQSSIEDEIAEWKRQDPAQVFFYRKGTRKGCKPEVLTTMHKQSASQQKQQLQQLQQLQSPDQQALQPKLYPQDLQPRLAPLDSHPQQMPRGMQPQAPFDQGYLRVDQGILSQNPPSALPPHQAQMLQHMHQLQAFNNNHLTSTPSPHSALQQQPQHPQLPQQNLPQLLQRAQSTHMLQHKQQHQSPPLLQEQSQPSVRQQPQLHHQPPLPPQHHPQQGQQPVVIATPPRDTMLLVHQTAWQQYLLARYGNELCVLDPIYRTTGCSLPLFFVLVKTNCDYQVVAMFIVEEARRALLYEALTVLKEWNPSWLPANFMTDVAAEDVQAVQQAFPGYPVYFCDFHRQYAWDQWLSSEPRPREPRATKQGIQAMLDRVAAASTEAEYYAAVVHLQGSPAWSECPGLQEWLGKLWLPLHQRWVRAFRRQSFVKAVNTSAGIGLQHKLFREHCLPSDKPARLAQLLSHVLLRFLPRNKSWYFQSNSKADDGCRKYSDAVPAFLRKRPRSFLKPCLQQWKAAKSIPADQVKLLDENCGIFHVQASPGNASGSLTVNLMRPDCSCKVWERSALPCKHILAALINVEAWTWAKLPTSYTESPYFTVDYDFVRKVVGKKPLVAPESREANVFAEPEELEQDAAIATSEATVPSSSYAGLDNGDDSDHSCVEGKRGEGSAGLPARCQAILERLQTRVSLVTEDRILKSVVAVLEKTEAAVNGHVQKQVPMPSRSGSPRAKRRRPSEKGGLK